MTSHDPDRLRADPDPLRDDPELLRAKLNSEAARIGWHELARFHAQGVVLTVAPALDLIAVAVALAQDDKQQLQAWLDTGDVAHVSDEQARQWYTAAAEVWAVVVAPWIVVQGPDFTIAAGSDVHG